MTMARRQTFVREKSLAGAASMFPDLYEPSLVVIDLGTTHSEGDTNTLDFLS